MPLEGASFLSYAIIEEIDGTGENKMKLFYVAIAILGGLMVGIQAPINGTLGKKVGAIEGSFFSFMVGTLGLFIVMSFLGKGNLGQIVHLPKWQLIGGLLGAIFVTTTVTAVPRIGVAVAISSAILGQMLASMVIDHFGFFGVSRIPFSASRFMGGVFMMCGLYLILRRSL